jgi:hypothetical protein
MNNKSMESDPIDSIDFIDLCTIKYPADLVSGRRHNWSAKRLNSWLY